MQINLTPITRFKWLSAIFFFLLLGQCTRSCNLNREKALDKIELSKKDSIISSQKEYIMSLKADSVLMETKILGLTQLVEVSKGNLDKFAETAKSWKSQTTIKVVKEDEDTKK